MLLPALAKAREKARAISCVNNLKQIGMINALYIMDSDDWVCPLFNGGRGSNEWNYGFHICTYSVTNSTNSPYDRKTFRCPSMNTPFKAYAYMDYGVNQAGLLPQGYKDANYDGDKLSNWKIPSKTVFQMDTWRSAGKASQPPADTEKGNWRFTLTASHTTSSTSYGVPAARHSGVANILWSDWHVAPSPKITDVLNPYTTPQFKQANYWSVCTFYHYNTATSPYWP